MIKLLIFDFDGVVADLKELHFEALNLALCKIDEKYIISKEEHISTYDGLGTNKKLQLLSDLKNFPISKANEVYINKQKATMELIPKYLCKDLRMIKILSQLKDNGYFICMASNSIRPTVLLGLDKLGILPFFDHVYSSDDVIFPKPHPEIYLRCMIDTGAKPHETLIIEDSKVGRFGASESKAYICGVDCVQDVSLEKIYKHIDMFNKDPKIKWVAKDTNVLIPMAGAGTRFSKAGYGLPKPLIDVFGKPMIQTVVENINVDANFIFVVQEEHYSKYNLHTILNLIAPGCKIIQTNGLTEGAACTTLLAKEYINTNDHLLIVNSDQYVEWDSCDFMYKMIYNNYDGGIVTFKATESKWSFAKIGDDGFVSEVAEKRPISDNATVGMYYWKHGSDYVNFAEQMIGKNTRVNNEFYVCPVFNEAIEAGKKIKTYDISKMWGLGTPEDLEFFIERNS